MRLFILAATAVVGAGLAPNPAARSPRIALPRVVIETTSGSITVEIDSVRAPLTAANFLRYVDSGAYTGGRFHRTVTAANQPTDSVRIAVIQAGANGARTGARFPAIQLEPTRDTGLRHRDGTISMARGGPNTAMSDFFICVGDQPSLDFGGHRNLDGQGFAAFGSVVAGMEVVRAINSAPANGQTLSPPIAITRIRRVP
jgi:peptidyl-prolyl cis-trans isomerase A (cyclophilin A)